MNFTIPREKKGLKIVVLKKSKKFVLKMQKKYVKNLEISC